MTVTAVLIVVIAALTLLLILLRQRGLTLQTRYQDLVAQFHELEDLITETLEEVLELKEHSLSHVVYDPTKDPTRKDRHEHEIATALVKLGDSPVGEPAPALEEQRPDTAPTRVPTPEELADASTGTLSLKRPDS